VAFGGHLGLKLRKSIGTPRRGHHFSAFTSHQNSSSAPDTARRTHYQHHLIF
jgi:hypothetical protein